ncbi:MAG: 3-oxoacyl-ACP synthase [Bacteroidetes bacterium]|nr:3-oxoacyl-ACP synthase [Bacteroidota bacterium]
MNKAYINGTGCISPQHTADDAWFFDRIVAPDTDFMQAIEPSYKEYISPNLLRRMGRAIKMGVASANMALQQAQLTAVDAIATGTGLGCFEDSERFLMAMLNNEEQFLTPTSFIQSTHNTVGSQIALILKCHDYNFTYVHRGFSFESALMDAMMWFSEGKETILIGGIEEHTPCYVELNRNAGKLKNPGNIPLWKQHTTGYQIGEGGAFFAVSQHKTIHSRSVIEGVNTLYKPETPGDIMKKMHAFLERHALALQDISLVLMGFSGHSLHDKKLQEILPDLCETNQVGHYKHLCGEYHTASAFATFAANRMIEKQEIPEIVKINHKPGEGVKHILIINQYLDINYSFILVGQC